MRIRHLAEVDLANLTVLPLDEQRRRMFKLVRGGGIFSFQPTREQYPELMNSQPELFRHLATAKRTPYSIVEAALKKRCKRGMELDFNLLVSKMLYGHFRKERAVSRYYDFYAMPLGIGRGVRFWVPVYYGRGDVPVVSFIDPRGGHNLTARGRDVAFSAMHFGIRERYPDFSETILQIIQTPYTVELRGEKAHRDRELLTFNMEGFPVFSFEQLDTMLTRTLLLWDEVCASFAEETRKREGQKGTLL